MKATLYKKFIISSSHTIAGHSKCGRLHGHNYIVEIYLTSNNLLLKYPEMFIVDFEGIKQNVQERFDHTHLNTVLEMNSVTCEILASQIFTLVRDYVKSIWDEKYKLFRLKVRVWETPTSYVEVEDELENY